MDNTSENTQQDMKNEPEVGAAPTCWKPKEGEPDPGFRYTCPCDIS